MRSVTRRAALASPFLGLARPASARTTAFLSAAADAAGGFRAAAFGLDGAPRFDLPIPARGHGAAVAPDGGTAVLFACRPGAFALALDPATGSVRTTIHRATERWFCGHGAFSADGATLYATEMDAAGEGVVGVYAAGRGYGRVGEFATGGADPHDVHLVPDGRALWVANGGIRTDPRLPRARLDLDDFDSHLVLLDAASGAALARHRLPEDGAALSLRHLAMDPTGQVFVAMQHEGPRHERPALVAATGAGGLAAIGAEDADWHGLDHYTGSAAASADGELVAITSPRGGVALLIDARSRRVVARAAIEDGCGVAPAGAGFVVTSGLGSAVVLGPGGPRRELPGVRATRLRWDNHLVAL